MAGKTLHRRSPAKINWYLRVLGKRPDGFHELDSLVSEITLYDDLAFTQASSSRSTLICDQPAVPTDERNLILRAVRQLAAATGRELAIDCRLTKRIPMGAGLGGGSSNAAATLLAVNTIFDLGLSHAQLVEHAARLGSDVAFFLEGGTAIMRGRGELIERAPAPWQGWIVLLMPELAISTADVYRGWDPATDIPDSDAIDLSPAPDAPEWLARLVNRLEPPARRVCASLGPLMDAAREIVGRPVCLSGSGSCMFTAFDQRDEAEHAAGEIKRALKVECRLVRLHDAAAEPATCDASGATCEMSEN